MQRFFIHYTSDDNGYLARLWVGGVSDNDNAMSGVGDADTSWCSSSAAMQTVINCYPSNHFVHPS